MTTTTSLYDNQTIQENITNSSNQSVYLSSSIRFFAYSVARCCQVCIGVPGNLMTLVIIQRIRFHLNMHVIMKYMAISDILSSATVPLTIYMGASVAKMITFNEHWDTICIVKTYFDLIIFLGSMLSYSMLSFDR